MKGRKINTICDSNPPITGNNSVLSLYYNEGSMKRNHLFVDKSKANDYQNYKD